jgi:hypothetical protein
LRVGEGVRELAERVKERERERESQPQPSALSATALGGRWVTALTRREAGGHVRQSQWRGHVQQPPPPWDKAVALERWWLAPERAPRVTAVCGYVAGSSAVVKVREWDGCGPPCAACRGVRDTVREVVRETSNTA